MVLLSEGIFWHYFLINQAFILPLQDYSCLSKFEIILNIIFHLELHSKLQLCLSAYFKSHTAPYKLIQNLRNKKCVCVSALHKK